MQTLTQINIFLESVAIGISNIWPACQNKKTPVLREHSIEIYILKSKKKKKSQWNLTGMWSRALHFILPSKSVTL
jgi:hypothetical protein